MIIVIVMKIIALITITVYDFFDIGYVGLFSPLQCIEIVSTSLVNGILNSQKGLILQT